MKQKILISILILAIFMVGIPVAAQQSGNAASLKARVSQALDSARHQPSSKTHRPVTKKATVNVSNGKMNVQANTTQTAYSDTSNVDPDAIEDSVAEANSGTDYNFDDNNDNGDVEKLEAVAHMFNGGMGVVSALVLLFIFGGPLFLIAWIIYLIFRNRREKYRITQEALKQNGFVPNNDFKPMATMPDARDLWARGIRDTALGVGLTLLFLCIFGWGILTGVGLLVTCIGVGKLIIVKTTKTNDVQMPPSDSAPSDDKPVNSDFGSTAEQQSKSKDSDDSIAPEK
jgi:hypothetical protein